MKLEWNYRSKFWSKWGGQTVLRKQMLTFNLFALLLHEFGREKNDDQVVAAAKQSSLKWFSKNDGQKQKREEESSTCAWPKSPWIPGHSSVQLATFWLDQKLLREVHKPKQFNRSIEMINQKFLFFECCLWWFAKSTSSTQRDPVDSLKRVWYKSRK